MLALHALRRAAHRQAVRPRAAWRRGVLAARQLVSCDGVPEGARAADHGVALRAVRGAVGDVLRFALVVEPDGARSARDALVGGRQGFEDGAGGLARRLEQLEGVATLVADDGVREGVLLVGRTLLALRGAAVLGAAGVERHILALVVTEVVLLVSRALKAQAGASDLQAVGDLGDAGCEVDLPRELVDRVGVRACAGIAAVEGDAGGAVGDGRARRDEVVGIGDGGFEFGEAEETAAADELQRALHPAVGGGVVVVVDLAGDAGGEVRGGAGVEVGDVLVVEGRLLECREGGVPGADADIGAGVARERGLVEHVALEEPAAGHRGVAVLDGEVVGPEHARLVVPECLPEDRADEIALDILPNVTRIDVARLQHAPADRLLALIDPEVERIVPIGAHHPLHLAWVVHRDMRGSNA